MALPFPHTSPLPAVPHKPHQPPARKLGFASKDRCAHLPAAPLHPAEAAALALEPCRGRRPPPSPRLRPQGSSCEKQAGKGKKSEGEKEGNRAGRHGKLHFPPSRASIPSEGPQTQELPLEPWASHKAGAASPSPQPCSHGGGSPTAWLGP